jgi:hypothetical protein
MMIAPAEKARGYHQLAVNKAATHQEPCRQLTHIGTTGRWTSLLTAPRSLVRARPGRASAGSVQPRRTADRPPAGRASWRPLMVAPWVARAGLTPPGRTAGRTICAAPASLTTPVEPLQLDRNHRAMRRRWSTTSSQREPLSCSPSKQASARLAPQSAWCSHWWETSCCGCGFSRAGRGAAAAAQRD